jgi:hypothetical protein
MFIKYHDLFNQKNRTDDYYFQTFPGQPGYHNGVLQNCQNSVDA